LEGMLMVPFVLICWMLPYQLKGGAEKDAGEVSMEAHSPSSSHRTERKGPSLYNEVKAILSIPVFINISLGYAAYCAVLAGISTFGPIFFQGLQFFPDEKSASLHFSAIVALAGVVGTPVGGYISDRLAGGKASREQVLTTCLRIMSFSSVFGVIFSICSAYCTTRNSFLFCMGTAIMFLFLPTGCCTMAVMESVPTKMRASAVALNILIMHVLGDVPSPIAIGSLKDYLAPNCNTKRVDGYEVLNPLCVEDGEGLRLTLVLCLSGLVFTVIFWTIPLVFPWCGRPAYGRGMETGEHLA